MPDLTVQKGRIEIMEPFKAYRIPIRTLDKLEQKKTQLARQDSLTAFIKWVLDLYADGRLEEVRSETATAGQRVVAASAEGIRKRDEQRKAS